MRARPSSSPSLIKQRDSPPRANSIQSWGRRKTKKTVTRSQDNAHIHPVCKEASICSFRLCASLLCFCLRLDESGWRLLCLVVSFAIKAEEVAYWLAIYRNQQRCLNWPSYYCIFFFFLKKMFTGAHNVQNLSPNHHVWHRPRLKIRGALKDQVCLLFLSLGFILSVSPISHDYLGRQCTISKRVPQRLTNPLGHGILLPIRQRVTTNWRKGLTRLCSLSSPS